MSIRAKHRLNLALTTKDSMTFSNHLAANKQKKHVIRREAYLARLGLMTAHPT